MPRGSTNGRAWRLHPFHLLPYVKVAVISTIASACVLTFVFADNASAPLFVSPVQHMANRWPSPFHHKHVKGCSCFLLLLSEALFESSKCVPCSSLQIKCEGHYTSRTTEFFYSV
mmetsp:Transcript_1419/g.5414  ORF Transcript_1419/g.5414 Transcript_1419/m.5414 type:complete len:115 (-) Transcript_1419:773-1117(-)